MGNAAALAEFERAGRECLGIAESLGSNSLTRRVLIPRFPGIEDSSRHWSVAMTIEHLLIAGEGMTGIIESLSQGITNLREVRIADVKPAGEMEGSAVLEKYKKFLDGCPARMNALTGINTSPVRHAHPWLWPLTARQWLCMNAIHNDIHLRQIREIVKRL